MSDQLSVGLGRRELVREAKWLLRRMPKDPEKLPQFLVDVVVDLGHSKKIMSQPACYREWLKLFPSVGTWSPLHVIRGNTFDQFKSWKSLN